MNKDDERMSGAVSASDEAVSASDDKTVDADRREMMQKALKVGAAAPVMMALFAGRKASATGEGVSGIPFGG